jgi:hypothetical protein
MRFLVLGAGALGGMLLKGGADLSFLVRPKRVAQLAEQGLIVKAPGGDIKRPVKAMLSGEIGRGGNLGRRCSGQHSNRRYRHKRVTFSPHLRDDTVADRARHPTGLERALDSLTARRALSCQLGERNRVRIQRTCAVTLSGEPWCNLTTEGCFWRGIT